MELTLEASVPLEVEAALTPPANGVSEPAYGLKIATLPVEEMEPLRPALQNSIKVKGLTASWSSNEEMPTLKNISLEVTEVSFNKPV